MVLDVGVRHQSRLVTIEFAATSHHRRFAAGTFLCCTEESEEMLFIPLPFSAARRVLTKSAECTTTWALRQLILCRSCICLMSGSDIGVGWSPSPQHLCHCAGGLSSPRCPGGHSVPATSRRAGCNGIPWSSQCSEGARRVCSCLCVQ